MDNLQMPEPPAGLTQIYAGWSRHNDALMRVLAPLGAEQLALRPAPDMWAVWQLASNLAGGRAYWFEEVLGEGAREVREMFRVTSTTVPGLSLADAGWEDDETHPRTAAELVGALEKTWSLVRDCLDRWSGEDLEAPLDTKRGRTTRGWVVWHVLEHDLQHGSEIAVILRDNGLATIEL